MPVATLPSSLTKRFARARELQAKLARYVRIEAELRELEEDPELREMLGMDPPEEVKPDVTTDSAEKPPAKPAMPEAPVAPQASAQVSEVPLSPTGRIQRGYLRKIFPEFARRRLRDWTTVVEMARAATDELGVNVERNSAKAAADALVKKGIMECDRTAGQSMRFRLKPTEPTVVLSRQPRGGIPENLDLADPDEENEHQN